ncbi:hypothetical protein SCOCK_180098 [Actinacidiphila cocklensis]|uniref:Uncharacterized protein n=1 Tax=Actinacidiphila cocklensis TaxID=887465 RepID=A0A9W4DSI2_9ACTN|nr:hypothetical protein SCOCK_180098 [Actinacidiphila cocklensis]
MPPSTAAARHIPGGRTIPEGKYSCRDNVVIVSYVTHPDRCRRPMLAYAVRLTVDEDPPPLTRDRH